MVKTILGILSLLFLAQRGFSQSVTIEKVYVQSDDGQLGGLLSIPGNCKKCPAVLIIQGSGPTDKDGNSALSQGKNNSLKYLSQSLNEAGIATLRFDKRGMGMSIGLQTNEEDLTFDQLVNDADLFLSLLMKDKRFKKIGIAGHSQGSLIGMLISQRHQLSAFASIAGPSFNIGDKLISQIEGNPYNPNEIIEEAKKITFSLKEGKVTNDVSPLLQNIYRPSIQSFLISWMKYDPSEEIGKLPLPILIINGSTDLQVNVEDAKSLKAASAMAELCIINGMNHILKNATANPIENNATYNNPDLPLNSEFKTKITSFFKQNLQK
jgi:pimeloyl-ACP methyl ester carboxylesterase